MEARLPHRCCPCPAPPLPPRETSKLRIIKLRGCMFVNQYLVVKFLGRGACGKVFLCLNTHDLRLYAMKVRTHTHAGHPYHRIQGSLLP